MRILLTLVLACFLFGACQKHTPDHVDHGVYIWNSRSSYNFLDTAEIRFLKKHQVQKLYCKLTDVVWNDVDHAHPVDTKDFPDDLALNIYYEIIPCIFITNEVMLKSSHDELNYMAEKIAARLSRYQTKFAEYQIDCDWSEKSQENYFYFLGKMKQNLKGILQSVTLRLYPYKYPKKVGIPPADRATLMLYNFKSPQTLVADNSIFDKAEAEKYLSDNKYPLPLDFAIPAFSWNILYANDGKFLGFIENQSLSTNPTLCKELKKDLFVIDKDTSLDGIYLRKGNLLKIESVGKKELVEARSLVELFKNTHRYTISVFDLNTKSMALIKEDQHEHVFKKNTP